MPIPQELKDLKKWVLWKKDEKRGKIPYSIRGGLASSTDPKTWGSFEDAVNCFRSKKQHDGIGFVITPEDGYVFIDLDHAKGTDWGRDILERSKSYTEFSPSGDGYHIICRGTKPGKLCKRNSIEMYDSKRYFTITGKVVDEKSRIVSDQALIDYVYNKMAGEEAKLSSSATTPTVQNDDNDIVLKKILKSKQSFKFKSLCSGNWEGNYGSQSEAVGALCAIVAYYTDNYSICDTIVRNSELYSGKWVDKWERVGPDFFNTAVTKFHKPNGNGNGNGFDPGIYDRHIAVVKQLYSDVRRDIFTDDLFVKNKQGEWTNAFSNSVLNVLKAECHLRGKKYNHTKIESFLWKYLNDLDRQLLIDIPAWDGGNRIEEMCSMLQFKAPVTNEVFADLFKDWCARAIGKLKDPEGVQNRCIILSGNQGIGKDIWVQSLFCAARQYLADLTMQGKYTKESEVAAVMSANFIIFISEFDKTEDLSIAALKDLITKPSFYFRQPYERRPLRYYNRASMIAACNPQNMLRDATGNRRFLIFHLTGDKGEAIKWNYPVLNAEYSLQILAEMKHLHEIKYKAQVESETLMETLISAYTPECIEEDLVEIFETEIGELISKTGKRFWQYKEEPLQRIVEKLSKLFNLKTTFVMKELKAAGCQYRNKHGRFYSLKGNCKNGGELILLDDREYNDGDVSEFLTEQIPL